MEERKKELFRIGVVVLVLLAALTIGEFFLGLFAGLWAAPLLAIAVLKAFFVVRDYMHIGRLFAGEEEPHA
jgi:hypothetical protein